jgi:thiol:disulfide interchange protein DsbD
MQASIWSDPTINKYFNNKVVMTALYTDEKSVIVDEENWFKSSNDGKIKKTLGDVNLDIQVVNFKTKSQPFYVLMSPDGVVLNTPMEYNSDTDKFLEFLKEGIENYETIGAEE